MKRLLLLLAATALTGCEIATAQTPAAGAVAVTVKNDGPGSSIVWIGPGSPPLVQGIGAGGAPTFYPLGDGLSVVDGKLNVIGGSGGTWGTITGTLSAQTDLQAALNAKLNSSAVSAFGLTLIDDADAAAARTTLGLGTLATQSANIGDYLTSATAASTYAALAGSYADPAWITSLAWSKITGAPSFLTGSTGPSDSSILLSSGSGGSEVKPTSKAFLHEYGEVAQLDLTGSIHLYDLYESNLFYRVMEIGRVLTFVVPDPDTATEYYRTISPPPGFANSIFYLPATTPSIGQVLRGGSGGLTEWAAVSGDGTILTTTGNGSSLTSLDPYALQQRSAIDGQVLTWSTANSRWQPSTVSGSGTVTSVAVAGTDGLEVDSGSPITSAGTITLGVNASSLKSHLSLGNVENTALSTWAGSSNITTLGTITAGTWQGTNIDWSRVSKTGSSLADLATRSAGDLTDIPVEIGLACSDETSDLTTGTAKVTFRMPHAMTLTDVRASVTTACTGSTIIVDINEDGASVLGTKLSIDASERTSTTAASAATITDSALADDSEITIDIDQVGSSTPGKGLKVWLIGTRN